ncbi:MAG: hypothetical protein MUD14_22020 [Hydrococcus sp. Prado102]|jgi:hypothetical protein|nr:hypothetical protein [Hydrococcus sp. Prado102]
MSKIKHLSIFNSIKVFKNGSPNRQRLINLSVKLFGAAMWGMLWSESVMGAPNGVWLSQPQIRFHASTNTIGSVMADIHAQNYRVVFLDFRNVPDEVQQAISQQARQQGLKPVVWVQSPQYRSLSVSELIYEARHGDGIQVDDHFFANYTLADFRNLRVQYSQPIFCSIQPFQSALVPQTGCNQLDVQCYVSKSFASCQKLADRLKAVLSLSEKDTYRHKEKLKNRSFNVFLWPYSNKYFGAKQTTLLEQVFLKKLFFHDSRRFLAFSNASSDDRDFPRIEIK